MGCADNKGEEKNNKIKCLQYVCINVNTKNRQRS